MRVLLFALLALFVAVQIAEACKCCCYGCGGHCGHQGGYGGGCYCGGAGCGLCNGGVSTYHHIISKESCAPAAAAAPTVIGIPILSSLGKKSCGCRGSCTCGTCGGSWD